MRVIWNAPGFRLSLLRYAMNCFSMHSCDAQAKDCVRISDVFGFYGEIFNGFISQHFVELSVGGMPSHGLCLARGYGIEDFTLGETLVGSPLKDNFWIWQNYFHLQIKLICILYK
jgi:hypothetical protein